ncbi:MAG: tyrosine-type recombinase/integrase [Pseudolabrys sp.]
MRDTRGHAVLKCCQSDAYVPDHKFGKPFAVAVGNWFRDRCNEAGLPKGISAHGLRKATARRLADLGCTAHQIADVTGHATLAEVQRYTKAADRKRLAREAMKKLIEGG